MPRPPATSSTRPRWSRRWGITNRTSAIATDHDAIGTEADVAITKTGPASIVAGNPLVYTITVTNTGPSDAAGVVVRDPTPPGLTWVSNTRRLCDGLPLHARRGAGRWHSHDHRDLHCPGRLQRTVADRERDRCVLDDGGHEHGEQHGHGRDDAESQCGRGDQPRVSSPGLGARGPADHLHRGGDQSRAGARHRPRRAGPAPGRPVVRVGLSLAGQLRRRPPARGRSGRC